MENKRPKSTLDQKDKKKLSNGRSGDGLELIKIILDDNPALRERVLLAVESTRVNKGSNTKPASKENKK